MKAVFGIVLIFLLGCAALTQPPPKGPAQAVSYSRDVQPILAFKCVECHRTAIPARGIAPGKAREGVGGLPKGGLVLTSYGSLMAGGASGQVVIPGKPQESLIIAMIRGSAKDKEGKARPKMPIGATPLTEEQIQKIEKWIEEGAKNN
jgi:mono/diheme cytochrome c family protein